LKQCLQDNNYIEIVSDYVGSSIIKPIWIYIYISNTTMQSQRVKLLKYKKESTLKVYQVYFYLYEEINKKKLLLG